MNRILKEDFIVLAFTLAVTLVLGLVVELAVYDYFRCAGYGAECLAPLWG